LRNLSVFAAVIEGRDSQQREKSAKKTNKNSKPTVEYREVIANTTC